MSSGPGGAVGRTRWLLFLVALGESMSEVDLYYGVYTDAIVNITHPSPESNHTSTEAVRGKYGRTSPKIRAAGYIRAPSSEDALACDPSVDFRGADSTWIALIERGNCTFAQKIENAAERGATAVVIYNADGTGNGTFPISHDVRMHRQSRNIQVAKMDTKCWSNLAGQAASPGDMGGRRFGSGPFVN